MLESALLCCRVLDPLLPIFTDYGSYKRERLSNAYHVHGE